MKTYEDAEKELIEYFTSIDAVRGQKYERYGDALHDPRATENGLLTLVLSQAWRDREKVEATLGCVASHVQLELARALGPCRHVSGRSFKELFVLDKEKEATKDPWGMLVTVFPRYAGLLPHSEVARAAYAKARGQKHSRNVGAQAQSVDFCELMTFLEESAYRTDTTRLHQRITEELNARVREALGVYEPFRKLRVAEEKRRKKAREAEIRGAA